LTWRFDIRHLSRSVVQPFRYLIYFFLFYVVQSSLFRKILTEQSVGIFICSMFPRTVRISKIDVCFEIAGNGSMISKLFTVVKSYTDRLLFIGTQPCRDGSDITAACIPCNETAEASVSGDINGSKSRIFPCVCSWEQESPKYVNFITYSEVINKRTKKTKTQRYGFFPSA